MTGPLRIAIPLAGIALVAGLVWAAFDTPAERVADGDARTVAAVAPTDAPGSPSPSAPSSVPAPSTTPPSTTPPSTTTAPEATALPAGSGEGRRVVFSVGGQRMWWVDEAGTVLRTAAVSGRADTPRTGTFQVYSKSREATGLDGSSMQYFVRFTKGPNGWAIGFHDIPVLDGAPAQTVEQLGQPLSHGCIRQSSEDAMFTWEFLDVGSTVVVVA